MPDLELLAAVAGLGVVTVVSRAFFMLPEREWPLPAWLREGLRYAPLAALAAVVVPEIVLTQGRWALAWADARPWAALAAALTYFARRDMLATIVVGTATMLALRGGLGW